MASPANQKSGVAKFDACGLLTKEEIEAIQGSPITDAKSSGHSGKGFLVSERYYATKDSSRSVSLTVTHKVTPTPQLEETRKMSGTRVSAGTMRMKRNASTRKIKRKRNVTKAATKRSGKNPIRRERSMASAMMPSGLGLGLVARFMC
jgi:hypothetical protein